MPITEGIIQTVLGSGQEGWGGDGGPANEAMLREPNDVFLDGKGGLLIADVQDQRIRRVDLRTGLISTFAGTGEEARAGDGKRAIEASLMGPRAVCMGGGGRHEHLALGETPNIAARLQLPSTAWSARRSRR
jgi:hypothetical protein